MIRRTYGSVKEQLARVTQNGMCSDNPQLLARVNEAQERLLNKGLYAGTYARYCVCVYDGHISLPREFDSVVGYNFGGRPGQVYNQWYQFMENGPGIAQAGDWKRLVDRGYVSTFRPLVGDQKIKIYTDLNEDPTSTILIRGKNANGSQVQTIENNSYIDGEKLNLSSGAGLSSVLVSGAVSPNSEANGIYVYIGQENGYPKYRLFGSTVWEISNNAGWRILQSSVPVFTATSSNYPWLSAWTGVSVLELPRQTTSVFSEIGSINKDVTKGWVKVYTLDPVTSQEVLIATLAPDETLPHYRRYEIPGFENLDGSHVVVLAKRKFIPAISDNDDLIITNLGALKMMLIAIEKEENNNLQEASIYEEKATELLKEELKETQGSAIGRPQVQMEGYAMGEIPALV